MFGKHVVTQGAPLGPRLPLQFRNTNHRPQERNELGGLYVGAGVLSATLPRALLGPRASRESCLPLPAPRAASVGPAPTSPDQGGPLGGRGCVDGILVSSSRRQGGALSAVTSPGGQAPWALEALEAAERGVCTLSFACSVMNFGPDGSLREDVTRRSRQSL